MPYTVSVGKTSVPPPRMTLAARSAIVAGSVANAYSVSMRAELG
jgi:hypothetical protein